MSEISYFVTRDILDAVFIGKKAGMKENSPVSAADLLLQFRDLVGEREENRLLRLLGPADNKVQL